MPDASVRGRLLIVGVNWLGDALLLTPAIRAVRKAFAGAPIDILVPARVRPVYARNPHLAEVLAYDDRAPIASPAFWKTVRELRARRYGTAILFHGSRTKARLVRWAGIPERWGTAGEGRDTLLTRTCPLPAPGLHRAQIYLDAAEAFGAPPDGRRIDFAPDPAAEAPLETLLREHGVAPRGPFAAVHPGGNWELKRWPVARFREWLCRFLEKKGEAQAVLCGSAAERGLALQIAEGFEAGRVAVLAGKTSLDQLALLFRRASFVLSNDSGPIHLAASQGARIVGLFGPTDPAQTGPWSEAPLRVLWRDPGCEIPCYFRSCDHRVCLDHWTADAVLEACEKVAP